MMSGPENSKPHIDGVVEQLRPDWSHAAMSDTPVTMDVAVPGGQLHVAVLGGGMPMVCLHGWALDNRMWGRSWATQLGLADQHQLIMPDRRGFGGSTAPPDLATEYRDIDHLVPEGRLILFGFSQGASVAMDYARHHPERVAAMVLIGAPLPAVINGDGESTVPLHHYRDLVASGRSAEMRALWAQHPLMRMMGDGDDVVSAMLSDYDGRDLLEDDSAILIGAEDIRQLPMPVLAMAGADEPLSRQDVARFIGTSAPQGRHILIEDAGHMCMFDNPAAFNQTISHFIRSHKL
jgi:pimeloyl-ACP methyl ester carboxylesterase